MPDLIYVPIRILSVSATEDVHCAIMPELLTAMPPAFNVAGAITLADCTLRLPETVQPRIWPSFASTSIAACPPVVQITFPITKQPSMVPLFVPARRLPAELSTQLLMLTFLSEPSAPIAPNTEL